MEETPAIILFILALLTICFFIFCIVKLLKSDRQVKPWRKLAASIMIGHIIFTLVHHIGLLYMDAMGQVMSPIGCKVYGSLQYMYAIFVPCSLLMFSIDRLIMVRNPTRYLAKMTKVVSVLLMLIPWLVSAVVTAAIVLSHFDKTQTSQGKLNAVDEVLVNDDGENITFGVCIMYGQYDKGTHSSHRSLQLTIMGQSVISFICVIVVLTLWCCLRWNLSVEDSGVDKVMRQSWKGAVISTALLNIFYIILFIVWCAVEVSDPGKIHTSGKPQSLFGVIEALVFIFTLKETLECLQQKCCKGSNA